MRVRLVRRKSTRSRDFFLLQTLEIGEGAEAKLLQWINRTMAHGWAKLREANTQPNVSTLTHLPCPKVKNFHEDLASGLALAAVIASQAPFTVAEVLSEINLDPKSPQLLFHNAVQVVKALELMQLDVDLTPGDIFHPNALHMTLALSRLYRLLPEYKIQSTISFKEFLPSTSPKRIFFWYPGKVIFHEAQQWYFDSLVRPLG
ncbi:unnamed protein product [Taenia asiatica]|uniref:Calponin-homology (CH) domain-containing protein n=1 Tax=Taenia asiatica TaxID=60517 RepID=A0A0R3VZK4_TAEAS|nr:unnamed protein product [Taenia asiatica]